MLETVEMLNIFVETKCISSGFVNEQKIQKNNIYLK